MQCRKQHRHSITSSALASNCGQISMPSTVAVLRLITSLNLVDWSPWFPVVYPALMQDAGLMRQFRPSAGHIKEVRP
jgi:hypothetical protein